MNGERGFDRAVLPNGVAVVGTRMGSVRSVAIGVWIRVGSRHESPAEAGMSHFLEHVVFKGTRRRGALAIVSAIESVGGHLDAFTGREATCLNARVLDRHASLAFDVLADLALEPRFDPEDVEKEKHVIVEEIHQYEDTPDDRVHDLFADVVWSGHPLGNRILGSEATVSSFTARGVADYHARHYAPPNLFVAVAGSYDWEEILGQASRVLDGTRSAAAPADAHAPPAGRGVRHLVEAHAQQYLCIGAAGLPHEHPDRYTLVLLSMLLGGGMSSRLFQRVREQEGLAYSVYAYADSYCDTGIFCTSMSVHPSHGRRALALTLEEFDRAAEQLVPAEELRSVKEQIKGNLILGVESTVSEMNRIARAEMYAGRYLTVDEMVALVERITAEDLRRVAGEILSRDRLSLVALGSADDRAYEVSDLAAGALA